MPSAPLYLGEAKRPRGQLLGLNQADRAFHLLALGRTGVGKSSLLSGLLRQDLAAGRGCAVIDPHGDLAAGLAKVARRERDRPILYLDPADPSCELGINPLRQVPEAEIARATSSLLGVLEKQWPGAWGVRMEHVLRASIYSLLGRPGSCLADLLRLYRDDAYRAAVRMTVRNEAVRAFWEHEFEPLTPRQRSDLVAPIENKLGALLTDPAALRTVVSPTVELDLRALLDGGGVLLVNLARGRLGADTAALLGSILVSLIAEAAFSRSDLAPEHRLPFYLYIDEFQTFTTRAFAEMVSELRKTRVALVLATQHLAGVQPDIRQAVLGNVGSTIAFRAGADDAALLAKDFGPRIVAQDFVNLPNREFYARLTVEGAPTAVVSGITFRCSAP